MYGSAYTSRTRLRICGGLLQNLAGIDAVVSTFDNMKVIVSIAPTSRECRELDMYVENTRHGKSVILNRWWPVLYSPRCSIFVSMASFWWCRGFIYRQEGSFYHSSVMFRTVGFSWARVTVRVRFRLSDRVDIRLSDVEWVVLYVGFPECRHSLSYLINREKL